MVDRMGRTRHFNRCSPGLAALSSFVLSILPAIAQAQWAPNGTAVCTASDLQAGSHAMADGQGGAYITWSDRRAVGSGTMTVYVQRMSAAGEPLWATDGVTVTDTDPEHFSRHLAPDGLGGVFVIYDQHRNGATDLHVQRLSANGEVHLGWPSSGIPIATGPPDQWAADALSDGNGGVYIAWQGVGATTGTDLYAQRIDASGSVAAGWPQSGLIVGGAPEEQNGAVMASDGIGGIYIAWNDRRSGTGEIFAQHVSSDGATLWQDGGQVVGVSVNERQGAAIITSGENIFVAWNDYRGNGSDVYLLRLSESGQPASGWPADGLPVVIAPAAQGLGSPKAIAADGLGGVLLTWTHGYTGTINNDVYLQRINPDGSVPVGWPSDGLSIAPSPHGSCSEEGPQVVSDGIGGAVVVWQDLRHSCSTVPPIDLYAQHISANGQVAAGWPLGGKAICVAAGLQYQHTVALTDPNHIVIAWDDARAGDFGVYRDIYAQQVRVNDGAMGGEGEWTQLNPEGSRPGARLGHSAIYDPVRERILVFGGDLTNAATNEVSALSLLGTPTWTRLIVGGTPPNPRSAHSAIYDPVDDRMVVVGGRNGATLYDDVWALSLAGTPTWTQLAPAGISPSAREAAGATYDAMRNRMVMFGGSDGTTFHNDVWALSLAGTPVWAQVLPAGLPPNARAQHSAVYDLIRDQVVVYAGRDAATFYNDVWTITLADPPVWTILTPAGTLPSARAQHSAVYDRSRDQMVMFAGLDINGPTYRNDAWTLALAGRPGWIQLFPVGSPPSPRGSQTGNYDPARDRMLVFGGSDGSSLRSDVWALTWGTPSSPPDVPSNLQAVTADCGATRSLTWTDNSADEGGFEIQWKILGQPDADYRRLVFLMANVTQFSHQPGDGLRHTYRIRTYRDGLFSAFSNEATNPVPDPSTPPPTPTGLKVENLGTGTSLKISWNAAPAATEYQIERSDGFSRTQAATEYVDTGLTREGTYTYEVSAVNECGASPFTAPVSGTADYFPVLLVHGIFGEPEGFTDCPVQPVVAWQRLHWTHTCGSEATKLGDVLAARGLRTYVARYDNAAALVTQVPTLRSAIDGVLLDSGDDKLIIVAHSQGGLVSRSLLQREPSYRDKVSRLVMLDTPNHGAALARLCAIPGLTHLCVAIADAAFDLNPASLFLNQLNYSDDPNRKDRGAFPDCGSHAPEDLAPGPEHWVLMGTAGRCATASFQPPCLTDGIVAVPSAFLTALPDARKALDVDLPGDEDYPFAKHYSGPINLLFGLFCPPMLGVLEHAKVATAVAEIVETGSLTTAGVPSDLVAREIRPDGAGGEEALTSLAWVTGVVHPQGTVSELVSVEATSELLVTQYGDQPMLGLRLRSPSNREITPADSSLADVDYDEDGSGIARALRVVSPEQGTWIVETINGGTVAAAYGIDAMVRSSIGLQLDARDTSLPTGNEKTILAAFGAIANPSPGASITCAVTRPDSVPESIALFDDGIHGDGPAGDGLFAGTYAPTVPGIHMVEATGTLPGQPELSRAAWSAFVLERFKDLSVEADDIAVTRPMPGAGDSLMVSVVIRNFGVEDAPAARVRLGSVGAPLGDPVNVLVPAGGEATAQAFWVPANPEQDTLVVTVDANFAFVEDRYDNNTAMKAVSPSTVSVKPSTPTPVFYVRAYPNPANGSVTFRFAIPVKGNVTLHVYDIAGRNVATLVNGVLPPGEHTIAWRRTSALGRTVAAGVYFFEMRAGQSRTIKRVVILR